MTYNKGYYEQNKQRIADYNKKRRIQNPEVIAKEKESYKEKKDLFQTRSKVQFLKGKMAWEMLSKAKKQLVLAEISEKLGVDVKQLLTKIYFVSKLLDIGIEQLGLKLPDLESEVCLMGQIGSNRKTAVATTLKLCEIDTKCMPIYPLN